MFTDRLLCEIVGRLHPWVKKTGVPTAKSTLNVLCFHTSIVIITILVDDSLEFLVPYFFLQDLPLHRRVFADECFQHGESLMHLFGQLLLVVHWFFEIIHFLEEMCPAALHDRHGAVTVIPVVDHCPLELCTQTFFQHFFTP